MVVQRFLAIVFMLIVVSAVPHPAGAGEIRQIYLSDDPLLSEETAAGVEGLFADIFRRVAEGAQRTVVFRRLPWKRAQKLAAEGNDIALGPLTRTKSRESKFSWIVPLFPMRIVYLTIQDQKPAIADLTQARRAHVAVKRGSTGTFAAAKHGLPESSVEVVNSQEIALQMLVRGRVDAWLTWDVIGYRARKILGSDARLHPGYTDILGDLYLAASPGIAADELARWRRAAQSVVDSGALDRFMQHYLGEKLAERR